MTADDARGGALANPPAGRSRRNKRLVLIAVGLAAVALAGRVLYDSSDELQAAADTLTHPRWGWVAFAALAEVASYLLRGGALALVLRAGVPHAAAPGAQSRPPARTPGALVLGAGSLAGDAAAYCLPFGFAASGVVVYGVLHRRRVDPTVAGWTYAVATVLYVGSIAALTVLAVQVAGPNDPIPGLWQVGCGLLVALALIGVGYVLVRGGRRGTQRAAARRRASGMRAKTSGWLRARLAELRLIRLPARAGVAAFALMTLSWLCNIAVLGMAYEAVGTAPPWNGLLLAYCASQIAAAVPITPGGIGVVEGSLTLALVAFGGAQTVTLAAVLLYRLVTYWACIPAGGLAWLALRVSGGPARRERLAVAVASREDRP